SSISYTLTANVENLTLTGAGAIAGTGNALNNAIQGNGAANLIDGGAGFDTMSGGGGNDTYVVDSVNDVVVETPGAGSDIVMSSVTYTLSADVETLTLTGAANLNGTGNALDNLLNGNAGNNVLNGGLGNDIMWGGDGNDTYIADQIGDRAKEASAIGGTDTVFASVSFALEANVENLTLTGAGNINGVGNASDNILIGNNGNNTLSGGAGSDSMKAGLGTDIYWVENAGDVVTELAGEGTDTVVSWIDYTLGANVENLTLMAPAISGTGNGLANILTGNGDDNTLDGLGGNDTLNGGAGNDQMRGGLGNDVYVVDSAGDSVTELTGEGSDTVQSSISYTLGANLEVLTLVGVAAVDGTGNAADNVLNGNGAANVLDGGAGIDNMFGGLGDDTYYVDNAGDRASELSAAGGTDMVYSSVSFTLTANVENLTLTGAGNITGVGNAGVNVLVGNSGNNTLSGGAGADSMSGGLGNDIYWVDDAGDTTLENAGAGTDTVQSSISWA
ncbi:MAG: calcium-binding protein, partial [Alphaproteobacteria bacterium]